MSHTNREPKSPKDTTDHLDPPTTDKKQQKEGIIPSLKLNVKNLSTPVLLSPKGTPVSSPGLTGEFDFSQLPVKLTEPSKLLESSSVKEPPLGVDKISLNDDPVDPVPTTSTPKLEYQLFQERAANPPSISPKSSKKDDHPTRKASFSLASGAAGQRANSSSSSLQRMKSSSSNPPVTPSHPSVALTPTNSSRSIRTLNSYQKLRDNNVQHASQLHVTEAVRPHSNIIRDNMKAKFSEQYQQQEKMYLNGIRKIKNRYPDNDDYFNKTVTVDDDDEGAYIEDENDTTKDLERFNSDLFPEHDDSDSTPLDLDGGKEFEALKALSKQIDIKDDYWDTASEYVLDSHMLLDLLNKNDDIQLKNKEDNANILERLEWQSILQTVLTGDVLTSEKTKLIRPISEEGESYLRASYKEDLWLGIRAKLFGRTEEDQKRLVLFHRGLADETLDEVLKFKLVLPEEQQNLSYSEQVTFASKQVNALLDKFTRCQELWRTYKEMENDKPQIASAEFITKLDALVAWTSITSAIERESDILKVWVDNDDLDILKSSSPTISRGNSLSGNEEKTDETDEERERTQSLKGEILKDDRSFVDRILKEKDIDELFKRRLFTSFSHWTFKAKTSYLEYKHVFTELGLPSYIDDLFVLAKFPSKLMKELMKTGLSYSLKLKNPTMMMIDQVLDDFKLYITLALEIRSSFLEYCAPQEGWVSLPDYQDTEFDNAILDCVHHYLLLLNRKLLDSPKSSKSFRTFKEPEELEREWSFLQNMGFYIEGGAVEIATQFTVLTSKLASRLNHYVHHQLQGPPYDDSGLDKNKMTRWYTSTMENFGQLRRKFFRFNTLLNQYFINSMQYNLSGSKMKKFLEVLKETNHVLYHSAKLADDGMYIFASETLAGKPFEVQRILKATHLGVDVSKIPERHLDAVNNYNYFIGTINNSNQYDYNTLTTTYETSEFDYILVIYPSKAMMWDGPVVPLEVDSLPIGEVEKGKVVLINKGGPGSNLDSAGRWFKECVGNSVGSVVSRGCSLPRVQKELQIISKHFFKMTCSTIDGVPNIRNQCRGIKDCQELVNNMFIYVRDVGRDSIRNFDKVRRSMIILKLLQLAIEWLSFVVDDCIPTDPKTFRWCVMALEFAMDISRGFNILTLDSEKFYRLRDKVAGCMSLLISHFDIMGARTKELQKKRMMNSGVQSDKDLYTLDDESINSLRKHIMSQVSKLENDRRVMQVEQQSVGRVLDNTDSENQLLTYLASSLSSVSIRWQKGKFLGGGTFGSVYASINLDTGGAMAVKEIRFHDRQSIKTVVPAIKSEMTVLSMLSHPNIVQFFGVEVHRDRVYIFMEYCSGGSLAGLIEYGRIEDESVIQLYTLQMLEGLGYLHQLGIIHRDIKPENILLDHLGVVKFVDFGSAKVIAIGGGSPNPTVSTSTTSSNTNAANHTMNSLIQSRRKSKNLTGTPMYMSPETIKGENPGKFGAIDIWSLGCCVLEMATGRRPWANLDNEYAVMYHIAAGHSPTFPTKEQLSDQGQEFLSHCLESDPSKRLSAVELLQDPWIQAIRNEAFSDSYAASSDFPADASM